MLKSYITWLVHLAARRRPAQFKALALAEDALLYLRVVPWLLVRAAKWAGAGALFRTPVLFDRWLAAVFLTVGLSWLVWAAWVQASLGGGTPHIAAPPVRLVTSGRHRVGCQRLKHGLSEGYLKGKILLERDAWSNFHPREKSSRGSRRTDPVGLVGPSCIIYK